jgi:hypothetical protein
MNSETQPLVESVTVAAGNISALIRRIRGQQVILDTDLAGLYGVPTFRFNEAVKRNTDRFPTDFMFRLTREEWNSFTSQFAILKRGRGQHRKYLPYAFTEHGALMAANVLNSPRAVAMSIQVIRAFVQFRQLLASHADLARKLNALEKKYDAQFKVVFVAIRQLMTPPRKSKREIGFHAIPK